jgi:hypothetical protein
MHADLKGEIDDLSAWRDRVVPLIEGVRRAIDDAGAQVTSIGDRLRDVVIPAMTSLDALAGRLSELADASAVPPGAAPEAEPEEAAAVIHLDDAERGDREDAGGHPVEPTRLPARGWAANPRSG